MRDAERDGEKDTEKDPECLGNSVPVSFFRSCEVQYKYFVDPFPLIRTCKAVQRERPAGSSRPVGHSSSTALATGKERFYFV